MSGPRGRGGAEPGEGVRASRPPGARAGARCRRPAAARRRRWRPARAGSARSADVVDSVGTPHIPRTTCGHSLAARESTARTTSCTGSSAAQTSSTAASDPRSTPPARCGQVASRAGTTMTAPTTHAATTPSQARSAARDRRSTQASPRHHQRHDERQRDEQPAVGPRVVGRDARTREGEQGRPRRHDERREPRIDPAHLRRQHSPPHEQGQHHQGHDQGDRPDVPGEPRHGLLRVGATPVDREPLARLHPGDVPRPGVVRVLAHGLPPRPAGQVQPGEHHQARRHVREPPHDDRGQPPTASPQHQHEPRPTPDEHPERQQRHQAASDGREVLPRQPHRGHR